MLPLQRAFKSTASSTHAVPSPNVSYVLHRNSAWPFPCKLFLCRGANIATFPAK